MSSCGDLDRWRDHHWVLLTWTDCINITVFCYTAALLVCLIGMIIFGMDMIFWCLLSDWHWFSLSDICMQPFYFLGRYKTYVWVCLPVSHLFLMKSLHPCVFLSWLNLIEGKLKKIILLLFPRVGVFYIYVSFTEIFGNVTCAVFMESCRCTVSSTYVVDSIML